MPAALAIADLVTLEEARLYCLRDETDTSYDGLWAVLIPGISEAASLWADRQFTPQDEVTRDFPAAGWAGRTILSPWELREAHTVALDGAEVDYGLYPIGGTSQGTYWSVEASSDGAVLTIDGDWGMLEVPPAVKLRASSRWIPTTKTPPATPANRSGAIATRRWSPTWRWVAYRVRAERCWTTTAAFR